MSAMITGIRSWIGLTSSLEFVVMIANVLTHSSLPGRCQFSQMPAKANDSTASHPNGIGLLWLQSLDRPPFKEAVNGNEAATAFISIAEGGKGRDGFGFGVNRLPSTISILAPMRDESPPQTIKGSLACLGILPDHPLLLTGGTVIARGDVQRLDQGNDLETELIRQGFLSDTTAHAP